jgi:signal peptidase I
MGDHRSVSYDSRGHQGDPGGGTIPESQVVGRAFVIMWPLSRAGILSIPATFKQPKLTASAMTRGLAVAVPVGAAMVVPVGLLRRRARRRPRRW